MPAGYVWWDLDKIAEAPLPAPVKKLLGQLAGAVAILLSTGDWHCWLSPLL